MEWSPGSRPRLRQIRDDRGGNPRNHRDHAEDDHGDGNIKTSHGPESPAERIRVHPRTLLPNSQRRLHLATVGLHVE